MGTLLGKRPFGRSKRRWVDNIQMDDPGYWCEDPRQIKLPQYIVFNGQRVKPCSCASSVSGLYYYKVK
jgi:hypothetical protein